MFERNKVDNAVNDTKNGVPAEITLADGDMLVGKIVISAGRNVFDQLNGPAAFIEIEPYGAERTYVAKTAMRSVKLISVPGSGHLAGRLREVDGFDPAKILGVKPETPWEEVRHAYHRMAKSYHPDQFQSVDLPPEVRAYLTAMLGRINVAFAALEKAEEGKSRAAARPSRPSPPKFGEGVRA